MRKLQSYCPIHDDYDHERFWKWTFMLWKQNNNNVPQLHNSYAKYFNAPDAQALKYKIELKAYPWSQIATKAASIISILKAPLTAYRIISRFKIASHYSSLWSRKSKYLYFAKYFVLFLFFMGTTVSTNFRSKLWVQIIR